MAGEAARTSLRCPGLCCRPGQMKWGLPGQGARSPVERRSLASLGDRQVAGTQLLVWWHVALASLAGGLGSQAACQVALQVALPRQAKSHSICLQVPMGTEWSVCHSGERWK